MTWYGRNVGIVPLTDAAGITQEFKPGQHYGVDIGWYKEQYCSVLAWQAGNIICLPSFRVDRNSVSPSPGRWLCILR